MTHHVTFIRHAQSLFNSHGIMIRNVNINDKGKQQASELNMEFDLVICSTLKRARETLDYSNIKYKNVIFSEKCREVLDGNIINYYNNEELIIEQADHLQKRIDEFKSLLEEHLKNGSVGVISHYGFLKAITGYNFGNCQYIKVTFSLFLKYLKNASCYSF